MRTIFSYSRGLLHLLDEFQIKLDVLFLPWEVVHGCVPSLPKLLLKSYLFHSIACLQEIKGGVPIPDRGMTVKGFYSQCKNIPWAFFLIEIGLDNSTAHSYKNIVISTCGPNTCASPHTDADLFLALSLKGAEALPSEVDQLTPHA